MTFSGNPFEPQRRRGAEKSLNSNLGRQPTARRIAAGAPLPPSFSSAPLRLCGKFGFLLHAIRHALAGMLLWALAGSAFAFDFSFALFGDTPYSNSERERLPGMIVAMARDGNEFAVHDGDIKDGIGSCHDALYGDILGVFQASEIPLIYLPGDNEWTDCGRVLAGLYDPVERLHYLRKLFFTDGQTLGRKRFDLERQGDVDKQFAEYRENVRWRRGRVLFVGLNVPGSVNNFGDGDRPSAEFLARAKANRAWLNASFELAHRDRYTVVFVMMQANPDFEATNAHRQNLGYGDFLRQLTELTLAFPGRVVLVHGDTHSQHIDLPMRDPRTGAVVRKFMRVETYGSPYMGWTKVTVKNAETAPTLQFAPHPWYGGIEHPPLMR